METALFKASYPNAITQLSEEHRANFWAPNFDGKSKCNNRSMSFILVKSLGIVFIRSKKYIIRQIICRSTNDLSFYKSTNLSIDKLSIDKLDCPLPKK